MDSSSLQIGMKTPASHDANCGSHCLVAGGGDSNCRPRLRFLDVGKARKQTSFIAARN
jgi:hypothetical protein